MQEKLKTEKGRKTPRITTKVLREQKQNWNENERNIKFEEIGIHNAFPPHLSSIVAIFASDDSETLEQNVRHKASELVKNAIESATREDSSERNKKSPTKRKEKKNTFKELYELVIETKMLYETTLNNVKSDLCFLRVLPSVAQNGLKHPGTTF